MSEIKLCDDGVQNFIETHTRSVLIDYDRWLRRELAKHGIVIPKDAPPDELQRLACEYRLEQYNYNYEIRDAIQFLLDELERVNRERNKLIEGLKFYANEDNWRSTRFVVGRAEAAARQSARDPRDLGRYAEDYAR